MLKITKLKVLFWSIAVCLYGYQVSEMFKLMKKEVKYEDIYKRVQ